MLLTRVYRENISMRTDSLRGALVRHLSELRYALGVGVFAVTIIVLRSLMS
jgi:hypothetical protein